MNLTTKGLLVLMSKRRLPITYLTTFAHNIDHVTTFVRFTSYWFPNLCAIRWSRRTLFTSIMYHILHVLILMLLAAVWFVRVLSKRCSLITKVASNMYYIQHIFLFMFCTVRRFIQLVSIRRLRITLFAVHIFNVCHPFLFMIWTFQRSPIIAVVRYTITRIASFHECIKHICFCVLFASCRCPALVSVIRIFGTFFARFPSLGHFVRDCIERDRMRKIYALVKPFLKHARSCYFRDQKSLSSLIDQHCVYKIDKLFWNWCLLKICPRSAMFSKCLKGLTPIVVSEITNRYIRPRTRLCLLKFVRRLKNRLDLPVPFSVYHPSIKS